MYTWQIKSEITKKKTQVTKGIIPRNSISLRIQWDEPFFFILFLENKLLLISINFTPKTSHSCLEKWYTMFSRLLLFAALFFLRDWQFLFPSKSRWSPDKNSPSANLVLIRGSIKLPRLGGFKWATKTGPRFVVYDIKGDDKSHPAMWGLFHEAWNKDPGIKQPGWLMFRVYFWWGLY